MEHDAFNLNEEEHMDVDSGATYSSVDDVADIISSTFTEANMAGT